MWKMAAILQTFCNFLIENFCIFYVISLKVIPTGPVDKMSSLMQVMAWHLKGAKPLPAPMMIQLNDGYMHH